MIPNICVGVNVLSAFEGNDPTDPAGPDNQDVVSHITKKSIVPLTVSGHSPQTFNVISYFSALAMRL